MSLSALYEYYHTWVRTIVSSLIIKYILATATLFLLDSLGYSAGTVYSTPHNTGFVNIVDEHYTWAVCRLASKCRYTDLLFTGPSPVHAPVEPTKLLFLMDLLYLLSLFLGSCRCRRVMKFCMGS